jgi:hypothetical protein
VHRGLVFCDRRQTEGRYNGGTDGEESKEEGEEDVICPASGGAGSQVPRGDRAQTN